MKICSYLIMSVMSGQTGWPITIVVEIIIFIITILLIIYIPF
jgi:hypothetical protein